MKNKTIVLVAAFVTIIVVVFFVFFALFMPLNGDPYFTEYYTKFKKTPTPAYSYSFSPPVSMYHALVVALERDPIWESLTPDTNITINVELDYCSVSKDSSNVTIGFQVLYPVTHSVSDWLPQQINDTTSNMYVWVIRPSITPVVAYGVDAVTAETVYEPPFMIGR